MRVKNTWKVIKVNKKSGAVGFEDVKEGDLIRVEIDLFSDIKFCNVYINNEFKGSKALRVLRHTLNIFELQEV